MNIHLNSLSAYFNLYFSLDEKLNELYDRIHDNLHDHIPVQHNEFGSVEVIGVEDESVSNGFSSTSTETDSEEKPSDTVKETFDEFEIN